MEFKKGITSLLVLIGVFASSVLAQQPASDFQTFGIDSENSILRIYVGRAGPLARMGHNHVVHTRDLSGEINLAEDPVDSTASFSFPISSFIVDDQSERDRAGEGFDSQPGRRAIEGTRENMLSEAVLNAAVFSMIAADINTISVTDSEWNFAIALDLKGNAVNLELPAEVTINDSEIIIDARFTLNHSDIGLSVFTALGGSLSVAEALDFDLHIEASVN
ncbi:MAG: hypothetical protein CMQ41_12090 [Gammaproteobacteria bacterium]|nr:hypothetical protein [Gammaproteobacteria bacterium]